MPDIGIHGTAKSNLRYANALTTTFQGHGYVLGKYHRMAPWSVYNESVKTQVSRAFRAGAEKSAQTLGVARGEFYTQRDVFLKNPPAVLVFTLPKHVARDAEAETRARAEKTGAEAALVRNPTHVDFQIASKPILKRAGPERGKMFSQLLGYVTMGERAYNQMERVWARAPKERRLEVDKKTFYERWAEDYYRRRVKRILDRHAG